MGPYSLNLVSAERTRNATLNGTCVTRPDVLSPGIRTGVGLVSAAPLVNCMEFPRFGGHRGKPDGVGVGQEVIYDRKAKAVHGGV